MTAGLTYWRCPECPVRVRWTFRIEDANPNWLVWRAPTRADLNAAEQMVEAHEAKHLGGGV